MDISTDSQSSSLCTNAISAWITYHSSIRARIHNPTRYIKYIAVPTLDHHPPPESCIPIHSNPISRTDTFPHLECTSHTDPRFAFIRDLRSTLHAPHSAPPFLASSTPGISTQAKMLPTRACYAQCRIPTQRGRGKAKIDQRSNHVDFDLVLSFSSAI